MLPLIWRFVRLIEQATAAYQYFVILGVTQFVRLLTNLRINSCDAAIHFSVFAPQSCRVGKMIPLPLSSWAALLQPASQCLMQQSSLFIASHRKENGKGHYAHTQFRPRDESAEILSYRANLSRAK
ncbi:hypothetical protein J6590_005047 [Homalodisca vitripennis]|nr:hypothetical protein J6590_005047 [Homalodisca vitripennis]